MSLLSRLATAALAALTAAGVLVATAAPAQAACATTGHVYVTQLNGQSRFAVRFENDPTGGPVTNFSDAPFRPWNVGGPTSSALPTTRETPARGSTISWSSQ